MVWRPRIKKVGPDEYELGLDERDRTGLKELAGWLRTRLLGDTTADSVRRLFPPAYLGDEDRDAEYQELMRDELLESRLQHLDVLEETAGADRINEEQLLGWMAAVNGIRLVLGTELDITEEDDPFDVDPDDPNSGLRLVYGALGVLLEELVDAMSS